MLLINLSRELQWKVLDHLDKRDKKQYSLVSRHCREVSMHALFNRFYVNSESSLNELNHLLENSLSLKDYVRYLVLDNIHRGDGKQYVKLIQLTPNLRKLNVRQAKDLFRFALQEIQHGHWSHLDYITGALYKDYHPVAILLKDRLSNTKFNIEPLPDTASRPDCVDFSLHITRHTRFNAVKNLELFSDKSLAIQSLDDALKLCPNATFTKLELFCHDSHKGKLMHIEPNMNVNELYIKAANFLEPYSDYICQKFPRVQKLHFSVLNYEPQSMNLSWEATDRLLSFIHSIDNVSLFVNRNAADCLQFFYGLLLHQRRGEIRIRMSNSNFQVEINQSKPRLVSLSNTNCKTVFDLTQENARAYLSRIDKLDLFCRASEDLAILAHCSQLGRLQICYSDAVTYEGPILPITNLSLELHESRRFLLTNSNRGIDFVNQFATYTPVLQSAVFTLYFLDGLEHDDYHRYDPLVLDIPSTSFESLAVNFRDSSDQDVLYIRLVRSGIEKYYGWNKLRQMMCEIEASEFLEPGLEPWIPVVRLALICKDIKCLKVATGPYSDNLKFGSIYVIDFNKQHSSP